MNKKSKSKATGESSVGEEKPQLAMPSSSEERPLNTLATSGSSQGQKSQIGFLPTNPLDIDEETTNAKLVITFASKLGASVLWKRLELADGQTGIALFFPDEKWSVNSANELVAKPKKS